LGPGVRDATLAAMRRGSAILALAFLVAGCASSGVEAMSPEATTEASAGPAPEPSPELRAMAGTALEPCTIGASVAERALSVLCGELTVPEDPSEPEGRTIDLRVAVVPAISPEPERDPVFMLAGGPGGAAIDGLAWTAVTFWGIHQSRDIVLVDQRGTGGSNEIMLDPLPDLSGLPAADADRAAREWVADQLAGVDADPAFYTTSVAMDDLDAVRAAIGYDQINLWGASYGATAAQYYVRQHGDRVRSVVLDGGTLLEVPVFERIAGNSQAALDTLFERCAADPPCRAAYPNLRADFERVLAALEARPVTVKNPSTGEPTEIDAATFSGAVHSALISADLSAMLPWFIDAAAGGRWVEAILAAQAAGGGDPPATGYPLMAAVIRCSEAWAVYDPTEVARFGAGSYYLEAQLENATVQDALCRAAPHGAVRPDDAQPATGDMPILFVVGSADPQDPPANIAAALDHFPNSATVVAEGHGHTVTHLGCLPSVVDAFVEAGTSAGLDTSCVAGGLPLPPFRTE
jgi:pimeloyl-ACP methyl ester carboxylesterase